MKEHIKKNEGEPSEYQALNLLGDVYLTTYTKKFRNRKTWSKPDEKAVISFIPGTIRQVLVKAGDQVKTGQVMLVLEAMKMMNTVYSPFPGKIKSVLVKEGDCLPKGTLMIEFE